MLADPRHAYFVGERDGVEAFAILRDLDDPHGNRLSQAHRRRWPGRRRRRSRFFGALLDWTFAQTPAHRFHLDCFDDNVARPGVVRQLGFSRDGVLREAYLDARRAAAAISC